MVEKSDFGKTSGAVVSLYVKLSQFFIPLRAQKGLKLQMCGGSWGFRSLGPKVFEAIQ